MVRLVHGTNKCINNENTHRIATKFCFVFVFFCSLPIFFDSFFSRDVLFIPDYIEIDEIAFFSFFFLHYQSLTPLQHTIHQANKSLLQIHVY